MKIRAEFFGSLRALVLRIGAASLVCAAFATAAVFAADCNTAALNALSIPNMTIASAAVDMRV